MPTALILMGVSGSGKSTVGVGLSRALGWPFYDGDDYHPQANIDKMARDIPLDDADRQPWLETLHRLVVRSLESGQSVILACSALKASYRQTLRGGREDVRFVHLAGDFDLIYSRMRQRAGHYMKANMLRSQFRDLEPPSDALTISIENPPDEIIRQIIDALALDGGNKGHRAQ